MTNDEKIIRRVFGRKDTPSSCEAKGLCWKALDPQHTMCVPCSKDSWSNMTSSEALTNCDKLDNTEGKYDMCMEASVDCGNDADCELARKYAQALKEGYSKDFGAFKKKVRNMGFLNMGLDFLNNLLNKPQGGNSGAYPPPPPKQGMSTVAKVGIGVGVLALIGVGVYFIFRKKD